MIKHTRVRVVNGKVEEGPLQYSGGYSKAQGWTDIRVVTLPPAAIKSAKYEYEKNGSVPTMAAKQSGAVLAFNASYVDERSGQLLGLTFAAGKQLAPDIAGKTEQRHHLYYANGRFGIARIDDRTKVDWAAQAGSVLVQDGKNVADERAKLERIQDDIKRLNPRIAAGLTKDGSLVVVAVDGRGNSDRGLYLSELADVMIWCGCVEAINLDGGGSATLYASDAKLRSAIDIKKGAFHLPDLGASAARKVHHAVVLQIDTAALFPPTLTGIDCATPLTSTTAAALAKAGAQFAVRYLVPPAYAWKRLTKTEATAIQAAGLRLASVFQLGTDRPKGGAANGTADGKSALVEAIAIGQPKGSAIFFAVDYNAPASDYDKIEAYLRAAAAELKDYHVGVYGHYGVIEAMAARKACRYYWQTYAWSNGRKSTAAHLWQHLNDTKLAGVTVDLNECYDPSIFWGNDDREGEDGVKKTSFSDVPAGHYAESSIAKAASAGVLGGVAPGVFGVGQPVTREQLAVILDRLGMLDK